MVDQGNHRLVAPNKPVPALFQKWNGVPFLRQPDSNNWFNWCGAALELLHLNSRHECPPASCVCSISKSHTDVLKSVLLGDAHSFQLIGGSICSCKFLTIFVGHMIQVSMTSEIHTGILGDSLGQVSTCAENFLKSLVSNFDFVPLHPLGGHLRLVKNLHNAVRVALAKL